MSLRVIPLTLAQANAAVERFHRHHKRAQGHRFSLGVIDNAGVLHGACIVGRPVARATAQYSTAEVTRLVTDGTHNACSILYAAAARACAAMGFDKIQTFVLEQESGISLRASGWEKEATSPGGDWNTASRSGRRTDQPQGPKARWAKVLRSTV